MNEEVEVRGTGMPDQLVYLQRRVQVYVALYACLYVRMARVV